MRISVKSIAGTGILAQAVSGRNALRKVLEIADAEPGESEPIFLDFSSVEVATSSFLREFVLGFRDALRARGSNFYPLICNANPAVEEELHDMLRIRGEAILCCKLVRNTAVRNTKLLGELDPKHRQTFDLVMRLGETDAGTLLREYGETDAITRTGWNNRLAALAHLGLVVEINYGRAKRYKPVLLET
jgi:hypothetical protein